MSNNQQKEEVKCNCSYHEVCDICCVKGDGKDKPESMVTTLEEDRESLRLWESVFRQSIKDNMRSVPSVAAVFTNELIPLINNLLAAKERVVRAECASRVTRRIRIWERGKCIISVDIQGDTIVPRLNKKNLKVTYEAFNNDLSPNYSIEKITKKDNAK